MTYNNPFADLSQNDRIRLKLKRDGYVTRNQCLSVVPAITRLGARIKDLEAEGYIFDAKWTRDHKDYFYTVIQWPDGTRREMTVPEMLAAAREGVAAFDAGGTAEAA